MDNGNSTAGSPIRARIVQVRVAGGGGFVKCDVFVGFLPGFSNTDKVQIIVGNVVIDNGFFSVK